MADKGERGGAWTPPFLADIIYEQPLKESTIETIETNLPEVHQQINLSKQLNFTVAKIDFYNMRREKNMIWR